MLDNELFDEFADLVDDTDSDEYYINISNRYINEFNRFKNSSQQTYQGINRSDLINCITVDKSDIMQWDHVIFNIDFNKLQSIGTKKTSELIFPNFVEEITSNFNDTLNDIHKQSITTIVIPNSVVILGTKVFYNYRNLKKIIIEENSRIEFIGNSAFKNCGSLKKIDLSNCNVLNKEIRFDNIIADINTTIKY